MQSTLRPSLSDTDRSYWLLLALTCLVWLVSGLFDREPWKADEAYSMGIVYSAVHDGNWLVPTLAGEPFLEKPPLVFWLAALSAQLLSPVLPLHVAARAANVVCSLLTFWLLFVAQRQAVGKPAAWRAVFLLAASPAYLFASRYMTADLGLMPSAALVMLGLVRLQRRQTHAGLLVGLGAGLGLLAKGLFFPGVTALTMLTVMVCQPGGERRPMLRHAGWAMATFAVTGLLWPVLLGVESVPLLLTWLWDNNLGRFLGQNGLGPPNSRWRTLGIMAAVLLPAWPLAVLLLRQRWGRLRSDPLFGPAVFGLAWLLVLMSSSTARAIYAIPALVPLCMLGAAGLGPLTRWQPPARLVWACRVGLFALTIGMLALSLWILSKAFLAESVRYSLGLTCLTAALAGSWLVVQMRAVRLGPLRSTVVAIVLMFSMALAVLLPRADTRTGYRGVFQSLIPYLPQPHGCVASLELGESERAMLQYYARLVTRRLEEFPAASSCPLRFEQQRTPTQPGDFGCPGMTVIWQGGRQDHPEEVFRLCRRG